MNHVASRSKPRPSDSGTQPLPVSYVRRATAGGGGITQQQDHRKLALLPTLIITLTDEKLESRAYLTVTPTQT